MEKDTALLLIVGLGAFGIYYLHNQPKQRRQCAYQEDTAQQSVSVAPARYSALKAIVSRAISNNSHYLATQDIMPAPSQKMLGFSSSDNNFFGQSRNNHFS